MSNEPLKTAFPHDSNWEDRQGMTLRDYFAAKTLNGLLSDPQCDSGTPEKLAELSYLMADAMLKAREQ